MRWAFLSAGIVAVVVSPLALAQESLCNPCVDPPPLRPLDNFSSQTATTIVTAEDMRKLGVISVADMVNQLPQPIVEQEVVNSEEVQPSSDEEDGATSEADSQPSDE